MSPEMLQFLRRLTVAGLLVITLLVGFATLTAAAPAPVMAACASYHTVRQNETLEDIADLYGLTEADLASANGLPTPYLLKADQSLCVPFAPVPLEATPPLDCIKLQAKVYQHKRITLYAENLPTSHVYLLKFRPQNYGPWHKVAVVRPTSKGTLTRTSTIPDSWRNVPRFRVCLKEVYRGYLACTVVNNH